MNLYELIGLIIGDGSIIYKTHKRIYRLTISGDVKEDREYFEVISKFIYGLCNKKPKIRERKVIIGGVLKGHSLELYINNKKFVEYLINELEISYGKDKAFKVKIPHKFLSWRFSKHILRGILESDGSLFFSKSKVMTYPSYPRLEIRTSSSVLANQVYSILKGKKYYANIMQTRYGDFKIYISGEKMLKKWIQEIGFSNWNTITKYELWNRLGYYIPRISLIEREKALKDNINPEIPTAP